MTESCPLDAASISDVMRFYSNINHITHSLIIIIRQQQQIQLSRVRVRTH